ncbi:MAG: LysR family transcriptional regulator [Brotaphodocola sp.]
MILNENIKFFLTVAECCSFTEAAKKLFVSHTALIKRMNRLEMEVGFDLFIRTKHGTILTPAGKELYHRCKEIEVMAERAIEESRQANDTLRIGVLEEYGSNFLRNILTSYHTRYPQVRLKEIE